MQFYYLCFHLRPKSAMTSDLQKIAYSWEDMKRDIKWKQVHVFLNSVHFILTPKNVVTWISSRNFWHFYFCSSIRSTPGATDWRLKALHLQWDNVMPTHRFFLSDEGFALCWPKWPLPTSPSGMVDESFIAKISFLLFLLRFQLGLTSSSGFIVTAK